MLKKVLCAACVMVMMAVSSAKAAEYDADHVAAWKARAEQGNALAQGALATCYGLGNCEGVPQDYAKARAWYEKAAAQGVAEAQHNLGILYDNGWGVRQDYARARAWYEKAAAQGVAEAQYNLGVLYVFGRGVRQDYAKARVWWEKAAAQRNADAQYNLGSLYNNGHGVRQNKATAKEWYGKACDNGNQKGCDAYRKLNEAGY